MWGGGGGGSTFQGNNLFPSSWNVIKYGMASLWGTANKKSKKSSPNNNNNNKKKQKKKHKVYTFSYDFKVSACITGISIRIQESS